MQINMTLKEYEMFRDFLKQRSTLEANVTKGFNDLLVEHLSLCSAVLIAIETDNYFHESAGRVVCRGIRLRDEKAAMRALTLARKHLEA